MAQGTDDVSPMSTWIRSNLHPSVDLDHPKMADHLRVSLIKLPSCRSKSLPLEIRFYDIEDTWEEVSFGCDPTNTILLNESHPRLCVFALKSGRTKDSTDPQWKLLVKDFGGVCIHRVVNQVKLKWITLEDNTVLHLASTCNDIGDYVVRYVDKYRVQRTLNNPEEIKRFEQKRKSEAQLKAEKIDVHALLINLRKYFGAFWKEDTDKPDMTLSSGAVKQAIQIIDQHWESDECGFDAGTPQKAIPIPVQSVAILIGKNGQTIKAIQHQTNCVLQISREEVVLEDNRFYTVYLTGHNPALELVIKILKEIVRVDPILKSSESLANCASIKTGVFLKEQEDLSKQLVSTINAGSQSLIGFHKRFLNSGRQGPEDSKEIPTRFSLQVHESNLKVVQGHEGETLRNIQIQTCARVRVSEAPDSKTGNHEVLLVGTTSAVDHARDLIASLIKQGDQTEELVLLPESLIGPVLGKVGEFLRPIETETGSQLVVLGECALGSTDRQISIKGSTEGNQKAKQLLHDKIHAARLQEQEADTETDQEVLFFMVPDSLVGLIIGKAGETIKQIHAKSGARVHISPSCEEDGMSRKISIIGKPDQQKKARDMVHILMENAQHIKERPSTSGGIDLATNECTRTFSIKMTAVGLLIGKGGERIRQLEKETGVRLQLQCPPDDEDDHRNVVLYGREERMDKCQEMILEVIGDNLHLKKPQQEGKPEADDRMINHFSTRMSECILIPKDLAPIVMTEHFIKEILASDLQIGYSKFVESRVDLRDVLKTHTPFTCAGSCEGISRAKAVIQRKLSGLPSSAEETRDPTKLHSLHYCEDFDGLATEIIPFPDDFVGVLIGSGGATIKGIQRETGATVQVATSSGSDFADVKMRSVYVTGNPEQIGLAKSRVSRIVSERHEHKSSTSEFRGARQPMFGYSMNSMMRPMDPPRPPDDTQVLVVLSYKHPHTQTSGCLEAHVLEGSDLRWRKPNSVPESPEDKSAGPWRICPLLWNPYQPFLTVILSHKVKNLIRIVKVSPLKCVTQWDLVYEEESDKFTPNARFYPFFFWEKIIADGRLAPRIYILCLEPTLGQGAIYRIPKLDKPWEFVRHVGPELSQVGTKVRFFYQGTRCYILVGQKNQPHSGFALGEIGHPHEDIQWFSDWDSRVACPHLTSAHRLNLIYYTDQLVLFGVNRETGSFFICAPPKTHDDLVGAPWKTIYHSPSRVDSGTRFSVSYTPTSVVVISASTSGKLTLWEFSWMAFQQALENPDPEVGAEVLKVKYERREDVPPKVIDLTLDPGVSIMHSHRSFYHPPQQNKVTPPQNYPSHGGFPGMNRPPNSQASLLTQPVFPGYPKGGSPQMMNMGGMQMPGMPQRRQLPPGWAEGIDPVTRRQYFIDHTTKTTHWTLPPQAFMSSGGEEMAVGNAQQAAHQTQPQMSNHPGAQAMGLAAGQVPSQPGPPSAAPASSTGTPEGPERERDRERKKHRRHHRDSEEGGERRRRRRSNREDDENGEGRRRRRHRSYQNESDKRAKVD